jgi:serine/threonine-protein kinase
MGRTEEPARDLLFGLIALQVGLVDQAQLVAAFEAWTHDKSAPLADHLVALGHLDASRRDAIDALVASHIEAHGDAERSIASLDVGRAMLERLRAVISAPEAEGSTISVVGADEDRTTTYEEVGRTLPGHCATAPATPAQRFRTLKSHAKGGLGEVFVALDGELNREVALKRILDHRADDPDSRRRFVLEAEITGGLEHPGIVPVYGLGSYGDGRPYYAMRFIRGDPLKDAIAAFHAPRAGPGADPARRSLELRRLLRRFTDVCNALEYAHSRGVLHRDLKPGNIIVGKYGETLVVDWGLAKATGRSDQASGEGTLRPSSASGSAETLPGAAIGTPAYMSPEQARGDLDAHGPRSDVYSLGATLYCLLTGRPPFTGDDIIPRVQRGVFPRPHQVDPAIDKALEAVCLKAMANRPEDRYASCRALADDIDHWLADEPVTARREPFRERARRWARRNRPIVTAAAAATVVALVGLGAVTAVQTKARNDLDRKNGELAQANVDLDLQRRRAEANETQAIGAVKRFGDAIAEEPLLKDTPELQDLRNRLLQGPLTFFRGLRERLQADRDTRPEALVRLAGAMHDYAHLTDEIGDQQDGLKAHEDSLAIWDGLTRDDPGNPEYQGGLAKIHNCRGNFLKATGRTDEARRAYEAALAIRQKLAEDHPTVNQYQGDLAISHHSIGLLLRETGQPGEARRSHEAALAIQRKLAEDHPTVTQYQRDLAASHGNLGALLRETGQPAEARRAFEAALAIFQKLAEDHPTVTQYQRDLAQSHISLGGLLGATGQPGEARRAYEAALAIGRKLADDHPAVTEFQRDLALSHNNLGLLLSATGEPAEARRAFEAALAIGRRLAEDHPTVTRYRRELARSHNNLGALLGATGQPGEAQRSHEAALAIRRKLAEDHPAVTEYQGGLATSYNQLGILLGATGQPAEARRAYEAALAIFQKLAEDHPTVTQYRRDLALSHNNLGNLLMRDTGQPAEARRAYEAALAILQKLAEEHPTVTQFQGDLARSHNNLGNLLRDTGEPAEARRSYESALAIRRKLAEDHPAVTEYQGGLAASHNNLGNLLRATGQPAEARRSFEAALAIRRELAEDHPEAPDFASDLGGTLNNLALIDLDEKHFDKAREDLQEAITWQKKALATNPRHPTYRQFLSNHLTNLIKAARGRGRDDEIAEAQREMNELRASDPRLEALDARLSAVLNGEAPKDNAERLALAQRAYDTKRHALAARLWAEAMDSDPKVADSRNPQHRYNAACAAALAADGQGKDDPAPDDAAKLKLRQQALAWLKAELAVWTRFVESGPPQARAFIAQTLDHWQKDTDLAGVRETDALGKLPEAERDAWRALWDEVGKLLDKAKTGGEPGRSGDSVSGPAMPPVPTVDPGDSAWPPERPSRGRHKPVD